MSTCEHCRDTGRAHGSEYLDCGYCSNATERVELEQWAVEVGIKFTCRESLWAVYQKDKAKAAAAATV